VAFSLATNFISLLLARILCGMGVSACLMAPLTGYRRWLLPTSLLRANSWMLMTGSLGMVASTLPVQWLMPLWGWRPLFWGLAAMVLLSMLLIAWQVPAWPRTAPETALAPQEGSYAEVLRHPYFRKLVPLGFFNYGGLVAIQTLWAVPWLIKVADYTPVQAATGLFWINGVMLVTFWTWGMVNPWLAKRGWQADRLIKMGVPVSLILLVLVIVASSHFAAWTSVLLALFCMSCTVVALAQPAVGLAFAPGLAGRALSAYNLVIFSGVFAVQWGIGLLVDGLKALGWQEIAAFQGAMGVFLACCIASYVHFVASKKP
jgi:predicted MFS family arabinose efflux permease